MHWPGFALQALSQDIVNNYGCRFFCTIHNSDTDTELGEWEGPEAGSTHLTQAWPFHTWLVKADKPHGMKNKWQHSIFARQNKELLGSRPS